MKAAFPKNIEFITEMSINFSTKGLNQVICLSEYVIYDYTPKKYQNISDIFVLMYKIKWEILMVHCVFSLLLLDPTYKLTFCEINISW